MSEPKTEKILNSRDGYYLKKMIEAYEQSAKKIAELEADNKSMKSMIEHLVSRYLDYRYDNEFFKGHSEHIDLLKMQQTLAQLKGKYDEFSQKDG